MKHLYMQLLYIWVLLKRRKITFRKGLNFLSNLYSYWTKNVVPGNYPSIIIFDVTNYCNLWCAICREHPNRISSDSKGSSASIPMGRMTYKMFSGIIGETKDHIMLALMYMAGEPLMNPDIYKMIEKATDFKVPTMISTNGMLLTKSNSEKLINSGLDLIKIAISGFSQEVYEKEHRGGDIKTILTNIENLAVLKKQMSSDMIIVVDYILYAHNEREFVDIVKFCSDTGVNLTTRVGRTTLGQRNNELDVTSKEILMPQSGLCDWLWRVMSISWDGRVFPCCEYAFSNSPVILGQYDENNSIYSLWNGKLLKNYRTAHLKKGRASFDVCRNCHYSGVKFQG